MSDFVNSYPVNFFLFLLSFFFLVWKRASSDYYVLLHWVYRNNFLFDTLKDRTSLFLFYSFHICIFTLSLQTYNYNAENSLKKIIAQPYQGCLKQSHLSLVNNNVFIEASKQTIENQFLKRSYFSQ